MSENKVRIGKSWRNWPCGLLLGCMAAQGALVTDVPSGYLVDLTQPQGNAATELVASSATNSGGDYGPKNLFDNAYSNDNSRWLATFSSGGTTYFTYGFTTPAIVNAVRLRVPNWNCNARAPKTWTIFGSADNATWTQLHSETDTSGTWAAQEARVYAFANMVAYKYYKVVVNEIRTPSEGWAQLNEVEFFNVKAVAASTAVASVEADAVTFATTVTRAGYGESGTVSVSVGTDSANLPDEETVLATDLTDGTATNLTFTGLAPATDYAYRLRVRNEAGGEVLLTGSFRTAAAVPGAYLSGDLTGPAGSASTASISGSPCLGDAYNWNYLFDNVAAGDTSRWIATPLAGAYATYEFVTPTRVNAYALTVPDYMVGEAADRSPTAWALEGSNDGEVWTTLHEVATTARWRKQERRVWTFTNDTAYKFYRLSIRAAAQSTDDRVQLAEMELFDLTGPKISVLGSATGATAYDISLGLGLPGIDATTCDVKFACGTDAANLPAEETLGAGVETGWTRVMSLANLQESTTYFYRVRVVSDQGVETVVTGSFATGKAEGVWSGASTETNTWSVAENWLDGSIPRNGRAIFALAAGGETEVDEAFALRNLFIDSTAGALVHGGEGPLSVSETVTNLAAATQTFAVPMSLGATDGAFAVNVAAGGLLETTGRVETAVNSLVKTGAGIWSVSDGAVLGSQNVVVEEGTLQIAKRDGHDGERYSRYVIGTTAPGMLVWRKVRLAEVVGVTALTCGSSMTAHDSYTPFHWQNDGTAASVQLQYLDSDGVKVVCLNLSQVGEDVYALNWRSAYAAKEYFGADFSTGNFFSSTYQATSVTARGYGAYCLRPVFAGDDPNGMAVGTGTITVKNGARLDVATPPGTTALDQNEATHGKTVYVAGSGPDGNGALYNSDVTAGSGSYNFGHVVLTDDTVAGGGIQSIRAFDGSAVRNPVLEGGSTFIVNNLDFIFSDTHFALDRLDVATKATLQGIVSATENLSGTITNGIHVLSANGAELRLISAVFPDTLPITIEPGGTTTFNGINTAQFNNALTIKEGARVEIAGEAGAELVLQFNGPVTNNGEVVRINEGKAGTVQFNGPIVGSGGWTFDGNACVTFTGNFDWSDYTGTFNFLSGTLRVGDLVYGCAETLPPIDQMTANLQFIADGPRAMGGEYDELVRKGGVAKRDVNVISKTDESEFTLTNATWDAYNLRLGTANYPGLFTIGPGATVNVSNCWEQAMAAKSHSTYVTVAEGGALNVYGSGNDSFMVGDYNDVGLGETYSHALVVDGGTVTASNATLMVGWSSNRVRVELDAGTMDVKGILVRNASTTIKAEERSERFIQRGGVLSVGANGITTKLYKDNEPYLNLANGTLRAMDSFTNTFGYLATYFGETAEDAGDYTIDLNGKNVTWNNALFGSSAVTVTGAGAFTTPAEVQGRVEGKWTVATETDATVDLSGAASFANGLELADGAQVRLSVASDSALEFGYVTHDSTGIARPAAVVTNDTPLSFVATDMKFLGEPVMTADPMDRCYRCWRGKFYVAEAATWHFAANFKQYLRLTVDDEVVVDLGYYDAGNVVRTGSKALTAGWHDFSVIAYTEDGVGPRVADWVAAKMAVGWSTNPAAEGSTAAADYTRFDTDTLMMRAGPTRYRCQQGANNADTWNRADCAYTYDGQWITLQHLRTYNTMMSLFNNHNSRLSGFFHVATGGAYQFKIWTAQGSGLAFWIDGKQVVSGVNEADVTSPAVTLAPGWHAYEIRILANGNVPHSGALKVKRPGDADFVAFDEEFLPIAVRTALAGVSGTLKLGEGSTLSNVSAGACPILDTLEGSGALAGSFVFAPDAVWHVEAGERALTQAVDLSGLSKPGAFFRSLKRIELVSPGERLGRARYELGPAGDLTDDEARQIAVAAAKDGVPQEGWSVRVIDGAVYLVNPKPTGIYILIR